MYFSQCLRNVLVTNKRTDYFIDVEKDYDQLIRRTSGHCKIFRDIINL